MNWKVVAHLIRVDIKSGRLIRGGRLSGAFERKLLRYILYGGALVLGVAVGYVGGYFYSSISPIDAQAKALVDLVLLSLSLSLPTLVLIYSLVFTFMQQIQRSGARFTIQAPYWLPITWSEHTLASLLANLIGFPLISIAFIAPTLITLSFFTGQVAFAVLTSLAAFASAFMASAITEILRTVQVRFIGAVTKSSGRAAVWVRFAGSLLFFVVFYIVYFTLTSGTGALVFVQTIASAQSTVWFVPFFWLGMFLYSFISGMLWQTLAFLGLSLLFVLSLFYVAVSLNKRFGLYEPPSITVSRGVYAPRVGLLGRLGFSTTEAALVRKDVKAFTRRRELMFVFVLPVVIILFPLLQSMGVMGQESPLTAPIYVLPMIFLMPTVILAVYLGSVMIGEEGEAMWRIYSAPISAKSLVKSKYFLIILFSTLVIIATGIVGVAVFRPSPRATTIAFAESFLLMFALSALSLMIGIKGPDFRELPRPRMTRPEWGLINAIACFAAALAILAPFIPYVFTIIALVPTIDPYQAMAVSAAISIVITLIAYRMALRNARELLAKAEM
jgi:hypothetical protein